MRKLISIQGDARKRHWDILDSITANNRPTLWVQSLVLYYSSERKL